jgi:enoyl-CoA hydratase/carnithine racemase
MSEPVLLSRRDGAVSTLCLNRPSTRNALDRELVDALGSALESEGQDSEVRVIVLAGTGGAFCSGVDLREAAAELEDEQRLGQRLAGFHRLIRAVVAAKQPVIAAVDGPAVGFGADLAFACDLRLASDAAYFEEKFVAIGLMPDGGGTFHLPRLIGSARALEHLLLGSRIDAALALSYGLVSRVVARGSLEQEARALAAQLASGPPLALTAIKSAVRDGLASNLEESLERERRGQLALLGSKDAKEGVSAFLERRAAQFRGH